MIDNTQAWSKFLSILNEFVLEMSFEGQEKGYNLLEDGYLDSIEFLNFLIALEDEFGVDLDLTNFDVENMDNTKKLFEFITKE